ncbi:hypothetical protein AAW14_31930 [Streptomyces hygroscopicus]|nr:hypothetical protein [Streptomyces hygroscopicus]
MAEASHSIRPAFGPAADEWVVPGYTDVSGLGRGRSGRVRIAVHAATGRYVAIKYLDEELRLNAEFRTAFRAEARLLGSLTSPHVTRLYEYVEAEQGAAIVMELVVGAALRSLLRQEGPTEPEAALAVLKGSLLGLAAAHGVGVVHRDYKPENVLVSLDGRSKLVDFGISVRTGDHCGFSGTPAYMPPEQWETGTATAASDVYSATVTFYECLTGQRPFTGGSDLELAYKHVAAPVPMGPVPDAVRGLVLHGMAKSPTQRPQNATVFLQELEWAAGSAYGPDWEERGQSCLAAVAAALVPLALSRLDIKLVGDAVDLARTDLPGRRRARLRGRGELAAGAAALAVAGLVSLMPGGWAGQEETHAGDRTQAVTTLDPRNGNGPAADMGTGAGKGRAGTGSGTGTSSAAGAGTAHRDTGSGAGTDGNPGAGTRVDTAQSAADTGNSRGDTNSGSGTGDPGGGRDSGGGVSVSRDPGGKKDSTGDSGDSGTKGPGGDSRMVNPGGTKGSGGAPGVEHGGQDKSGSGTTPDNPEKSGSKGSGTDSGARTASGHGGTNANPDTNTKTNTSTRTNTDTQANAHTGTSTGPSTGTSPSTGTGTGTGTGPSSSTGTGPNNPGSNNASGASGPDPSGPVTPRQGIPSEVVEPG